MPDPTEAKHIQHPAGTNQDGAYGHLLPSEHLHRPPGFTKPFNTSTTNNRIDVKNNWKREVGDDIMMAIAGNFQRYCGNQTATESLRDPTIESIKMVCSTTRAPSQKTVYSITTMVTAFQSRRSTTSASISTRTSPCMFR